MIFRKVFRKEFEGVPPKLAIEFFRRVPRGMLAIIPEAFFVETPMDAKEFFGGMLKGFNERMPIDLVRGTSVGILGEILELLFNGFFENFME